MIGSSIDTVNPRHLPGSAASGPLKVCLVFLKRRGDIQRLWTSFDVHSLAGFCTDFRHRTRSWSLAHLPELGPA